ncbi:hypothetical protein B7486_33245 [cyanobacterium TDX16]|nr:hypothetical protein B7486_33245 [cyanobacterium TDX16]
MTTNSSDLGLPSAPNNAAPSPSSNANRSIKKGLSLRLKTTLAAVAIGTLPVVVTGIAANLIAANMLDAQIELAKQEETAAMMDKVERFLFERYGDIQALSNLPILRNEKVKQVVSVKDRSQVLTNYAKTYEVYDNIAFIDLNGNNILVSQGVKLGSHKTEDYFQAVLATGKRFISQPRVAPSTGKTVIYLAAPVRDSVTHKIIGVVRTQMPVRFLDDLVKSYGGNDRTYHLVDKAGKVFVTNDGTETLGMDASEHLAPFPQLRQDRKAASTKSYEPLEKRHVVGGYAPFEPTQGLPDLGWDAFILSDRNVAFAVNNRLAQIFALGTLAAAVAVSAIAVLLVNRSLQPIEAATKTVQKLGAGDLDVRLAVKGSDELAMLGANINQMADQIQDLLDNLKGTAEIKQLKEAIEQESHVLQSDVGHLLDAVAALEGGDLTIQAPVSDRATGLVADTLNRLIEELARIMATVLSTAQQVTQGSTELEQLAAVTARQAQQQAQSVSVVQASVVTFTDLSQQTAQQALASDQAVQQAQIAVTQGQEEMVKLTEEIKVLHSGTEQIVKRAQILTNFVTSAAQFAKDQKRVAALTRVLALNASMIAARASGQQDPDQFASVAREFETIATQVNDLAVQTNQGLLLLQQQAAQIQTVVSGINQDVQDISHSVNQFVGSVEQSQHVFELIKAVTDRVAQVGQQVTASSQAIAIEAQTTLRSIEEIATVAAKTEQQSSFTQEQAGLIDNMARTLLEKVSFFRISEEVQGAGSRKQGAV